MGPASRPIAIGIRVEHRLHPRLQIDGCNLLRDPVGDRRHPEHPRPRAVRLRYLHRLDRRREVGPRAHPIPDLVEIILQIGLERLQILIVHPWPSIIVLDPPKRLPDHPLGNRKRLLLGLWHVFSLPPGTLAPVVRSIHFLVSRPLRSTPTPASRSFVATTSRSAGKRRVGTQRLWFLPRARSLPRP